MHKIYNRIIQIAGNVIAIEAKNIGYNELAEISSKRGKSLAQVIRIDGERIYLEVFAGSCGRACPRAWFRI